MDIKKNYQVIVIGGGMVGLSFAALMIRLGLKVALIETTVPELNRLATQLDARVSALNLAAEKLFTQLGVWSKLSSNAAPLEQMRIWDGQSGAQLGFDSAHVGVSHLGSIVENHAIVKVLWEDLQDNKKLDFYCPAQAESLQVNEDSAILKLMDGSELTADLIVGCDGAHSWLRQKMQAELHENSYEQKAIVTVIHTEKPHQNIAWQNFLATGPLALLPLKDPHRCAIVWSCDLPYAHELMHSTADEFNRALSNASEFCLGKLESLNSLQAIPLFRRHVQHYVQPRLALLGDAAHTMHPLAGQGVNFGLMDAQCLAGLIQKALTNSKDFGAYSLLRRYERARKAENEVMLKSVGAFKTLFGSESTALVQLRALGMQFLNKTECLKEFMARYAMGG